MKDKILVTGGAGYIGSHTIVKLLESNYEVIAIDNFSNSSPLVCERIKRITGKTFELIEGDIRDRYSLREIFKNNVICSVMHFAGLKAVGESYMKPLHYYDNNVNASLILFDEMSSNNVKNIVFSSSATVYKENHDCKFCEDNKLEPKSVYGKTKLIVENILSDIKKSDPEWRIANLRYFNPIGAHCSGLIGENPKDHPKNLLPYISQVALGKKAKLFVFGDDYPTEDGTGKRDYIHVEDLSIAHLKALKFLFDNKSSFLTLNLGSGKSYSVLEMIKTFEKVSEKKIPYEIVNRRSGDLAESVAIPKLAKKIINWETKFDLLRMCEDAWRWKINNPDGF